MAPILHRHGIITVPRVLSRERLQKPRGHNQNLWDHVILEVEYRFYGPDGDYISAVVTAEGLDNADKGSGKAMTMAYKTALLQVLGIASDDDPDALNPADEGPAPAVRPAPRKATAKRAPAKKAAATKKASPPKKAATPQEQVKELLVMYGPEHAARVESLIISMNDIQPSDAKAATKAEFVRRFGRPGDLEPQTYEEAAEWVTGQLTALKPAEAATEASSGSSEDEK